MRKHELQPSLRNHGSSMGLGNTPVADPPAGPLDEVEAVDQWRAELEVGGGIPPLESITRRAGCARASGPRHQP